MLRDAYADETIAVLTNALKLTPEQVEIAREALAVAWEDKIAGVVTVDDVIALGKSRFGCTPTPEQAQSVLFYLDAEYDPAVGLTTDVVVAAIEALGFNQG